MIFLLAGLALAEEPQPCQFEKPVNIGELRDAMKTCWLPVGSQLTVQIEEVDPVETKPGIGFHSNDSTLTSNGKQTLDGIASVLSIRKRLNVKIVGYADRQESGDLLDLSLRRAQAASSYLIGIGIDPARISVEAAGADKPVESTGTAEGRARNRRVEFVVLAP